MDNIYETLEKLAKSIKAQNLFVASKEVGGIYLFRNRCDFSKLQEIFLSHLYNFDCINRDIVIEKISKKVLDNKVYWDSYLLWKQKNYNKKKNIKDNKTSELSLITGNKIIFPDKEK